MSNKKIVNLGKVKAKTKELRLNGKIIEHKYDDEQNWQPLVDLSEAGSSIDTVSAHSELPSDARENDVAIVEEEEYVRTENKTVVLPIEVKLPTEDQEIPNIYNINFRDSFNSILNNEEVKSLGSALNVRLETETRSIMYVDIGAEIAPMMAGTDHPAQIVAVMNGEENMNFYVSGISIRDFLQLMMELELEEEQWATLLGSHANDSSADSPSYGWVNMVMSTESINDNSLDMDGVYATLLFDSEAPKITDILSYASVGIMTTSGENIDASTSLYSTYDSSSDVDPEEQAFVLKFVNLALNNIAHGGIIEQSNDIYNPKGLFQNDNGEWVSLEEKMNTPRFVDTYADLPKTSIENGIMAVAKESVYETEPTETTVLEMYKSYRLKSIDDITSETINSIIETLLLSYPTNANAMISLYLMDMNANNEMYCSIVKSVIDENNTLAGIIFSYEINDNITRRIIYLTEIPFGTTIEDLETFPPAQGSDTYPDITLETGKWYWGDVYDDEKDECYTVGGIVHEGFPIDEFPDNVLFGGGNIEFDNSVYPATVETYDSSDNYKEFATLDTIAFHFDDLNSISTITYPAGFYRYQNNEWVHVKDVSGGKFENEDLLRSITAEDVGNVQENTEKRHEHSNKSYLDQIQGDAIDKINNQVPQNTSARHTHNNQDYLNQISDIAIQNINKIPNMQNSITSMSGYTHYHENRNELDSLRMDVINNSHTHTNKSTLDKVTETHLTDIASNTSARHTHSNKNVLDKFSISNSELLFDGERILSNIISKSVTDEEEISGINLENGVLKYVSSAIPEISISLDSIVELKGEAWLSFICNKDVKITFPTSISWEKGILPPIDQSGNYRIVIRITSMKNTNSTFSVLGEWFGAKNVDSRLLPSDKNCRFAKIEDGEIIFASKYWTDDNGNRIYNDESYYLEEGYKKVLGEDPYELSSELKPNDECELMFKEYDDFIIVYWIVTPKGARIDSLINSKFITNWSYAFSGYNGSSIKDLIYLGEIDTGNGTNFRNMFENCSSLTEIPNIDTSNGINFSSMFWYCSSLETIPEINTSKGTTFNSMFLGCSNLKTIPEIDTSNGTDFWWMFRDCSSLQEIPELDTSNGIEFWGMFSGCTSLEYIPTLNLSNASFNGGTYDSKPFASMFYDCTSLITIEKLIFNSGKTSWMSGIFGNYISWPEKGSLPIENITIEGSIKVDSNILDLSFCPNLTVDSLMSFINAFEDNVEEETQYTITIGATNLTKLTAEQIAIAVNKNILLA